MRKLLEIYRAVHEQAFIPIFVDDDFDSRLLLDACVAAGTRCIEYTLRRRDANQMIPWIRENYPDLILLVGSTIDDDSIIAKQRRHHPQLVTISELDAMDVHGFVSMLGWHEENIREFSQRRIIVPTAMTSNEAFFQVGAGAHFVKLLGNDMDLVRLCRAAPTFEYCPIFVTGGVTENRISEVITAGAVLTASGFDVILKGQSENVTAPRISAILERYIAAAKKAREEYWPQLQQVGGAADQAWLDALPHYHPF